MSLPAGTTRRRLRVAAALTAAGLGLGPAPTTVAEVAAVLAARTAPADAAMAAGAKAGGWAVGFGLENRDGKLDYEVQVATATSVTRVLVDPAAGAATPSPGEGGATPPDQAPRVDLTAAIAAPGRAAGAAAAAPVSGAWRGLSRGVPWTR